MTTYLLKRFLLMPVMLFGITLISFGIIVLAPGTSSGGPASGDVKAGRLSQQQLQVMQQTFHIGEPWYMRYMYWVGILQAEPYASDWRDLSKAKARELVGTTTDKERKALLEEYIVALNIQGNATTDFRDAGRPLEEKFKTLDADVRKQIVFPKHGILFLDFGKSVATPSISVSQRLAEALPITLLINLICFIVIYGASIPIGIMGAVKHNSFLDRSSTIGLFVLYSLPSFWVALLLIKLVVSDVLGFQLPFQGILPTGAERLSTLEYLWEGTKHLVLPVVCLSYASLAVISRYMRVGMLDCIRSDFIRTARAKGCPEEIVIFKHALRNSLIPIATLLGGLLPGMIGGAFIIESIFSIPGMGLVGYQALLNRDYTILMAEITISAVLVMLGILVSDLLYLAVDPRIAFGKER